MHIPTKESTELDILTFDEAKSSHNNSFSYDKNKWIYIPDFYSDYRYVLGTVGDNPLITIGINPSTAQPEKLDNTLKSVNRIAFSNGFDSFIMLNVYAQRATLPNDMDIKFNERLHKENMKAFEWVLGQVKGNPTVWAAWGTIIEKREYLKTCLEEMVIIGNGYNVRWCNTGKPSKNGHPRHPLYLREDSKLTDFDITSYLTTL